MIVRTFRQCEKVVNKKKIFVATDHSKIQEVCNKYNINVIMTSNKCLTGTDRVAEVAKKIRVTNYINVQGDEPFFNPNDLKKLIKISQRNPRYIYNGYCEIDKKTLFYNYNIPKVVLDNNNKLLYMSRAPIPSSKQKKFIFGFRQVCAYSFPYLALKKFYNFKKKTKFEKVEDIEILRFLELGYAIKMIKMSKISKSIDIKADLKKIL